MVVRACRFFHGVFSTVWPSFAYSLYPNKVYGGVLVSCGGVGRVLGSVRQLDSRFVILLVGAASGGSVTIRFTLSIWVCDSMGVTVTVCWVWRRHSSDLLFERRHRRVEAFSRAVRGSFCLVLW